MAGQQSSLNRKMLKISIIPCQNDTALLKINTACMSKDLITNFINESKIQLAYLNSLIINSDSQMGNDDYILD